MGNPKQTQQKRRPSWNGPVAPAGPVESGSFALPAVMLRALRQVISRQWRVNFGAGAATLLALLPALWLAQALADDAFNLPRLVRGCLLLVDAVVAAYLLRFRVVKSWRRKLTLPEAALLVEREIPGFRSSLISAVELSREPRPSELVRTLIQRCGTRLGGENVAARVVDTRSLRQWSRWALASVAVALAVFFILAPASHVLLARLLLFRRALPTRTVVVNLGGGVTAALGGEVTLSCRARGVVPRSGRLVLAYANGASETVQVSPSADDPAVFAVTLKNLQQSFTCHFELNDGVGEPFRVTVQVPPALVSCDFLQIYPAYTRRPPGRMSAGNLSLLAGSRVQINGRATQALQAATLRIEGTRPSSLPLTVAGPGRQSVTGEFAVPKEGLTGFSLLLRNTAGVSSKEDTVYSVDFVPDTPPTVELALPSAERSTVTATARPTLRFSVRDDYGLRRVSVRYEVEHPSAGGVEPARSSGEIRLPSPPDATAFADDYLWDLPARLPGLAAGSTVWFWIEAVDNNDVTGPGIGLSAKKALVILSAEEKRAELLERLGVSAAGIEELYQNQRKANEELNTTIRQITH